MTDYRKKLIEVALPLDVINAESAREKSIRHGHPSTLHLWWSRKPLAACRAVVFASLVDDPGEEDAPPELLERIDRLPAPEQPAAGWAEMEETARRRQKLFSLIERLVKWQNSSNEQVLGEARSVVQAAAGGEPPPLLDPFCGGGSIPLEAQRLGLTAHGSELNPVAALITKSLIELPPKFAGEPPVNPASRESIAHSGQWRGAQGLAEDVRFYGRWMRDEAERRIGWLYPTGPAGETVIAWLWSRTVPCPNPACGARMPLASKFWLSKKKGKKAWAEPVVDRKNKTVSFEVHTGEEGEPSIDGTVNRRGAHCIVCDSAVPFNHVRAEGQAGRMSQQLMAVVAEGNRGRTYLPPTDEHVAVAEKAEPEWKPDQDLPEQALGFRVQQYGMTKWSDLFTDRQLVALTTFSDLVSEVRERVWRDTMDAGLPDDGTPTDEGSAGARAYADAVATYLAFAVDKVADRNSVIASWADNREHARNTFVRQAIPMMWDFAESNPFSESSGNYWGGITTIQSILDELEPHASGAAKQLDATASVNGAAQPLISTDPPYYDNISYADLADFFYVWLRRSLGEIYPDTFGTMLTPKSPELVATPYRFGGDRHKAREFFEEGLGEAFRRMREAANPEYPLTIYYAFKQAESESGGDGTMAVASTGWESMLEGLMETGFQITGTWPIRTELGRRMRNMGSNALASSIVMVCRPRPQDAEPATRQQFVRALRKELPGELRTMMSANIAPVDLAQATIGPGMAIFSRYSRVVEAEGSPMRVRTALQILNGELDATLSEQESEMDSYTRFCVTWFEQRGFEAGPYGEAEGVARARNIAVDAAAEAGVVQAGGGKVRLLSRAELPEDWDPETDGRLTEWEIVQHLIRALDTHGERGAGALLAKVGERGEAARDLAYRLFRICEQKEWAEEARAYDGLVKAWPEISRLAAENPQGEAPQTRMDV